MRLISKVAIATILSASAFSATAFQQQTHKQIAIDAVNYMQANPSTTNFAKLEAAATAAGYTVAQIAEIIGQGAYDVDDFKDTYICGAITGDCVNAPVWGVAESIVQYTSYWHFQNHTQGSDAHGNDIGGYNYDKLTRWGAVDNLAATWLVNDHLDDGNGGMTGTCIWAFGWHCSEDSEYNSYGVTEANYRQGSTSNKGMYEDFQNIPWQPIDNLGQHWYNQFLANPTFQTLGFVMHTTDLLQPHHVWTTSDLNHSGWESWVGDNYFSQNLNDSSAVTAALGYFNAVPSNQSDIRPIMTQGGAFAYSNGGIVLDSTDHNERLVVGKKVIPHAIAMVVTILNHAADQFSAAETQSVSGDWSNSGGRSATASGNPKFTLTVSSSASATIDLMSSVDTYMYLLNSSGSVIASNDDGGSGYNSRLTKSLSAGTYTVVAATYSSGKSGSFTLTTTAGSLAAQ